MRHKRKSYLFLYLIISTLIICSMPLLNEDFIKLNVFKSNAAKTFAQADRWPRNLDLVNIDKSSKRNAEEDKLIIKGDKTFKENTSKALELLKGRDKRSYTVVKGYVGRISQAKSSGMAAYEKVPTFYVGKATSSASTTWYASAIAHDAYHSKLYHDYKNIHGDVPENIWGGYDAEMKCLEYQIEVLKKINAPKSEIEYATSLIGTNWWDGPVTW